MVFDAKLYVAGNNSDHTAALNFLLAFGVSDDDSFRRCLKYADWLFTMPHAEKVLLNIGGFTEGYSDQELATINIAGNMLAPLSDKQKEAAGRLIMGAPLPQDNRQLGWFLRRFVGLAVPAAAVPYVKASDNGAIGRVTDALKAKEINVVSDTLDVHAELKLLNFVHSCIAVSPGQYAKKVAHLGGLKKTCKFCRAWVGRFPTVLPADLEVTVALPENDGRPEGQGAGKRPINAQVMLAGVDAPTFAAMFNGLTNKEAL